MKEIRLYKTDSGKEPFEDWLAKIKDKTTKARIRHRKVIANQLEVASTNFD